MKETDIIKQVKSGNLKPFRQLFEKNKELIFRVCLKYLKNADDAMDCVQETFIKAYQSIDKFRGESSFSSWLTRIAINHCLNKTRNMSTRKRLDNENEEIIQFNFRMFEFPAPDREMLQEELKVTLYEALGECSDRERMIFTLKNLEEYKIHEISTMMGISEGTVKSTLFKTVRKLRGKLEKFYQYALIN